MADTQTYQNHVRRMPPHVGVLLLILLANIIWSGYRLVTLFSVDTVLAFLVALALVVIASVSRTQTLTVQNRLIRLEERLRYSTLLPPDLAARAAALPLPQIVALRFASDAELPGLVSEVLAGQLATPKEIKLKVRDWKADFLRA
jgi:hypothetical protein